MLGSIISSSTCDVGHRAPWPRSTGTMAGTGWCATPAPASSSSRASRATPRATRSPRRPTSTVITGSSSLWRSSLRCRPRRCTCSRTHAASARSTPSSTQTTGPSGRLLPCESRWLLLYSGDARHCQWVRQKRTKCVSSLFTAMLITECVLLGQWFFTICDEKRHINYPRVIPCQNISKGIRKWLLLSPTKHAVTLIEKYVRKL